MAIYVVTYDLNKQKDYPRLYKAIMEAGTAYCHAQDSTWFVESTAGAAAIRDYLAKAADYDDTIFVGQVSGDSAWALPQTVSNWLMAKL